MKSNLHLWMPMKRLALSGNIEKPWPHTARSRTCPPHHQPLPPTTPTCGLQPSAPLALPLGSISQQLFPLLCSVARNTCWEPFHPNPSLGTFKAGQAHLPTLRTHPWTHTPSRLWSTRILIFSVQTLPCLAYRTLRICLQSHK